jgi:structural maintenance of chromosome 4
MPPRRTTRLSAASSASSTSTAQSVPPATRTRKQTRLGVASSLQDDDDENNDHQGDDSDDSLLDGEDESEQESTPIPPKRATRTSRSTPIASSSLTTKPPSRKPPVARGKAKAPEPVTSARRSARLSVSPLPEAPPVKATRNGKVQKTKVVDSDEDEDDEMEESVMVASQREDEDDEEQDEDSLAEDPDRTIQPGDDDLVQDVKPTLTSPSKPSFRDQDRPNDSSDEEEDFIEQDLVEQSIRFKKTGSSTPRPLSPTKLQPGLSSPKKPSQETLQSARFASPSDVKTQSLPSPVPVIEQGLKKRLVIRKMALVNFKSYKGRQEIGPFHKVTCLSSAITSLMHPTDRSKPSSHSPPSSDRTDQGSRTRSTPCSLSLVIELARCVKGN